MGEGKEFIPSDIESADHLAMSNWEQILPSDAVKYFENGLPEGATVEGRMYAQLGLILRLTEGDRITIYILEHGDKNFPEGKALEWHWQD